VSAVELLAYVDAVERRLTKERGREHVLSPRDFALVRDWQRAGVPLVRVLAAIDDATREGATLTSLAALVRTLAQRPPR
jgi:hypothetical protein